jgi:hypothetical protein
MLFVIMKGFTAILFVKRKKKAVAKESSRWVFNPSESRSTECSEASEVGRNKPRPPRIQLTKKGGAPMTQKPTYIFHSETPDELLQTLQTQLLAVLQARKFLLCDNEAENPDFCQTVACNPEKDVIQ